MMQHCEPSPSLLQPHKAHNIASPHQSPKMQKRARLPRHLADNTRRNVKWTSEASAAKREKNSLEQLTVVSFHAHSPKLKQRSHWSTSTYSCTLHVPKTQNAITTFAAPQSNYTLSHHLFLRSTKTFCLRTQPSRTESLLTD
jgi:hypothetical protein